MANEPKLEIYKLRIFKKENGQPVNLRELFRAKLKNYGIKEGNIKTNKDIFNAFYHDFIKSIDLKYNINDKKKKAFTIAYDITNGEKKSFLKHYSNDTIITGRLEGGKHGRKRGLGVVDDATNKVTIRTKNVVTDRFYFLLFTPIDHCEAIVMIQSYTEIKISDVFRDYLLDYFKYQKEISSKAEIFVPISLREKYLNGATFKSLNFTTEWHVEKGNFDNTVSQKEYDFEIKIEITDKSNKKIPYNKTNNLLGFLGKSIFKLVGKEQELDNFDDKKAKMTSSEGTTLPIDFDDEFNIKPVIHLKQQGINVGDDGIPNFDQIDAYCKNILKEISKEILPENAIKDL